MTGSKLWKGLPALFFFATSALSAVSTVSAATAAPAVPAASIDPRGFLYGRVTTDGGTVYEGRLRWNDEEAFWGDLFNSTKKDLPYEDDVPERQRRQKRSIRVFGIPLGFEWDDNWGRQLVVRFGDIRSIEPKHGERATLTLKSGTQVEVEGGSNDLEGPVLVWSGATDPIQIKWDKIRKIEFMPTPADLQVSVHRLYGTVKTRTGDFHGFIQWDQEECVSTDELDGETRDGDVELAMGEIRSIERRTSNSSNIVLNDGRKMVLDGTNDVDGSNRGIYVDDPRFGRVLIDWDVFLRADFSTPPGSGPAYTDYRPGRPIYGKVTTTDGASHRGRIVYDIDESETNEFLDGDRDKVSYSIPFARLAYLIPERSDSSRVVLKDGTELKLEDSVDIGRDNAGLLVFENGKTKPLYIKWRDVQRVDFEEK